MTITSICPDCGALGGTHFGGCGAGALPQGPRYCPGCGSPYPGAHYRGCGRLGPPGQDLQPGPGALTAQEVRRIVREELDRPRGNALRKVT